MAIYEPSEQALNWHKTRLELGEAQKKIFVMNVGMEPAAFGDCMHLIDSCLRWLTSNPRQLDLSIRTFIGILGHSYQLLISAWDDLEEGRLAASADHWRSLLEAPDFLIAVCLNEDFARAWADPERRRTLNVENAQATVRRTLNSMRDGLGDARDQKRKDELKGVQAFAHISRDSAGLVFFKPSGATGTMLTAEGFQGPETVQAAGFVAYLAHEILGASAAALNATLPGESTEWRAQVTDVYERTGEFLRGLSDSMFRASENDGG